MKNVIKFIYGLVKVLPLIGELLEIFARKQETTDSSNPVKPPKDIIDNV